MRPSIMLGICIRIILYEFLIIFFKRSNFSKIKYDLIFNIFDASMRINIYSFIKEV